MIQLTLTLSLVLPFLDLLRRECALIMAATTDHHSRQSLETLLGLFHSDFPNTGKISVESDDSRAVLRACSCVRIHLRKTRLASLSNETVTSTTFDPKDHSGEDHEALTCFHFLATLQVLLLNQFFQPSASVRAVERFTERSTLRIKSRIHRWRTGAVFFSPSKNQSEIIVLDDPVNLMGYVTAVFWIELGVSFETAERRMREVHELKRSIVWTGPTREAKSRAHALRSWCLTVCLRPVSPK